MALHDGKGCALLYCGSMSLLLAACSSSPAVGELKPSVVVRGVDSGVRQDIDNYYSVEPDCSNEGYPEIRVIRNPDHGSAESHSAEVYPSFNKDNVRYECNKKKVASSQLTYQSAPGFHGKDTLTIEVRYVHGNFRLVTYSINVL